MAIVSLNGDSLTSHTIIGNNQSALTIEARHTWRKRTGYAFSFDGQTTEYDFNAALERDINDPATVSEVASYLCSRINSRYSSILDATVSDSTVTVIAKSGNTLDVSFDIEANEGGYAAYFIFETDLDLT